MVDFLSTDKTWQRGFGTGVVFMLMNERCPQIFGIYDVLDQEQLFLLAHQMGYIFQWKKVDDGHCAIQFDLSQVING